MKEKQLKKTIFTLNINMEYSKDITAMTYPLIQQYADKIGAEFYIIKDRKFPKFPITYEKLQIYKLSQKMKNDWNIYIDSDTLVHPETIDFTEFLKKDTVAHNGIDMANVRWTYDNYFRRDGRNAGSCNWLTFSSDWCIDLWHPLEDLTLSQALCNIRPTVNELNTIITKEHLIDDYVLSRNIAKYGLKLTTLIDLLPKIGLQNANFFWHLYTITIEEKIKQMQDILTKWQIKLGI